MKNYFYVFWDYLVVLIIWIFILIYSLIVISENYLFIVFGALASFYFAPKALRFLLFLVDLKIGIKQREVLFQGVLIEENLDVFFRIKYTYIYFDDEILKKNYMVFSDVMHEDIKRGDIIRVSYYPLTRVIVKIEKHK